MIDRVRGVQSDSAVPRLTRATGSGPNGSGPAKPAWTRRVASAVLAATLFSVPDFAGAAIMLDGLNGTWSGRGKVTFEAGNSEDLSCRAYYTASVTILSLALRCASASYKTEIRSKLQITNGSLAGEWEECNFNAVGSALGAVAGNSIVLRISGTIAGRLTIEQSGAHQSVTIATNSGGLASVRIGLSRS